MVNPKLTAAAACRVAGIDRDRFNEHVAAGRFPCAPSTIPGRARLFEPEDMIPLCLFREFMDDGLDADHAGPMACTIGVEARVHPDVPAIAYVECFMGSAIAMPADEVPASADWSTTQMGGRSIRKVTIYNVHHLRQRIANGIEEERSIIGEND